MKKFLSLFFVLFIPLVFTGCENGNELRTVAFTEITSAGSENYAFRVDFSEDKRVDNKYYDIQIKSDGRVNISIGREFQEKKVVELTQNWQSLTTLMLDEPNTETFMLGSEAQSLVYILTSQKPAKITLRAVVGGIEDNATGTGKIITSPEECSNEFVIEIK